jgi:hypothetical protein
MHDIQRPADSGHAGIQPVRGTLRRFEGLADQKADEYRYWHSRPAHERLTAVSELSIEGYKLKGTLPHDTGLRGSANPPQR